MMKDVFVRALFVIAIIAALLFASDREKSKRDSRSSVPVQADGGMTWYRDDEVGTHAFIVTWKDHIATAVHHPDCPCRGEALSEEVAERVAQVTKSVNHWISP